MSSGYYYDEIRYIRFGDSMTMMTIYDYLVLWLKIQIAGRLDSIETMYECHTALGCNSGPAAAQTLRLIVMGWKS